MSIKITWHGHATFSIEVDGTHLIIDPFLKGNNPVAQTAADEIKADYVLITHGHGDHVADAMSIAQANDAMIITNFEIANWYNEKGHEKTHPQHIGGGYQHPFGHVKLTPALHGSALPDGSYGGMPTGFLLTMAGKKIYVAGDTGLFSDMSLIGRDGLDLAILPIGDNFTMGPEDAFYALDYLKPKVVIPCHYNTWPPIEVDVDGWVDRVNSETDTKAVKLEVDGVYELS